MPDYAFGNAIWRRCHGDRSHAHRARSSRSIVGVTRPDFFGLEVGKRFDIALPICAAAAWGNSLDRRDAFWLSVTGRLNPGWSVARAADHMNAISPGLLEATLPSGHQASALERYRRFRLTVVPAATGVSELRTGVR